MNSAHHRPVFLNLLRIRQPVTAVLSILHRITGVLMLLLLPVLVYLLALSLSGPEGFARVADILASGPAKFLLIILSWVLGHHLLAGIRFLLLDFDLGISRAVARQSAWLTHAGALVLTLITAGVIL
jgi:succinate dehydrogenase / fumarate reductase cytochrome b subunit